MSDAISILLIDSHPSVRSGLRALIETVPGMEVVGDSNNRETAVALALRHHPDIIILDMMPPGQNGLGIMRAVRSASPNSKFLILTDNGNSNAILHAVEEGASGYLLKDPLSADIASAVRDIMDGKFVFHYGVARVLRENHLADLLSETTVKELPSLPKLNLAI